MGPSEDSFKTNLTKLSGPIALIKDLYLKIGAISDQLDLCFKVWLMGSRNVILDHLESCAAIWVGNTLILQMGIREKSFRTFYKS